jgi:predicted permease
MSWFSRLKNAIRPWRLDNELDEEYRDHIERRTADLRKKGLSEDDARRQAMLRFGNPTQTREQSRDIRLWTTLETTLQDARYAWRTMRRVPGFAITAVLSLALAIGANTAIFSIVDAAMLHPLPVADPSRLIMLSWPEIHQPGDPVGGERESFSYPVYQEFRQAAGSSARLALFAYPGRTEVRIGGSGAPLEHAVRQFVSGDAFEMLGVPPALGRLFTQDDDRVPGGHPLAILSYEYWASRFGADPMILGRGIEVEGKSYSVLGVARKGFFGVEPGRFVDIWLPALMYNPDAFKNPGWGWFRIIGRLSPGSSREQLQARLQPPFHRGLQQTVERWPTMPRGIVDQFLGAQIRVHPGANGPSGFRRDFTRPLWIVLAIVGGMLLIACANVASLLLARAVARSPEMAMRVSLGAARGRLVRQLLTECLLLSTLAGAIGWVLARASAPLLVAMLSTDSDPVRFALAMDTRMLLFSIAISTLAAVVFGLTPAWQASGEQPVLALRGASAQAGKLRMGRLFVGIQAAFAFCLVVTGAAFLFSLRNLIAVDTGFDARGVTVLDIGAATEKQPEAERLSVMHDITSGIAAIPGIEKVSLATWPIFVGTGWSEQVIVPGKAPSDREEIFYPVSPGYFATLRTPLLGGRDFEPNETQSTQPVPAIVNLAFARKYFNSDAVVGREFQRPTPKGPVRMSIVGLAANAHYGDLRHPAEPIVYVPVSGEAGFTAYVRSPLTAGPVVRAVEAQARAVGHGVRVREVTTLETLVGNTLLREKLLAGIGGVFALLGLVMAAIGMFGVLSYSVSRRTREIGIRTALGAQSREIAILVVRDLFPLLVGGVVVGIASSLASTRVLEALLFGVRPADPIVMGTACLVFLVAACLAGGLPARRAAAVDPTVALRFD